MINTYFSDTEAVEACICRLNVMWCDVMWWERTVWLGRSLLSSIALLLLQ